MSRSIRPTAISIRSGESAKRERANSRTLKGAIVGLILAISTLFGAFWAAGDADASEPTDGAATTSKLVGARLIAAAGLFGPVEALDAYARQCAPCHGTTGEGGIAAAAQASTLSSADRLDVIANGRGEMPAFGATLSTEQLQELSDVYGRFAGGGIYNNQCSPCHGPTGEGGLGPRLQATHLASDAIAAVIANGRDAMPSFAPTLSEGQLEAVVAFLTGPVAGAGVYADQCALCHGTNREGSLAPALTTAGLSLEEQMSVVASGRDGMPSFESTLTDGQQEALAFFLASPGVQPSDTPTPDGLYADNCAACHGAAGEGGAGPALAGTVMSESELATTIREGRGSMLGFVESLTDDNIDAVAAFVANLAGAAPPPSPPEVVSGEDLYAANCTACHGGSGEGGAGPPLLGTQLSTGELADITISGRGSMPAFSQILSSDEVEAVAQFVTTLAPGSSVTLPSSSIAGGELFNELCAGCHGTSGEGGRGPVLAGAELSANDIVVDIWAGHSADMPSFHGFLTPSEIVAIASYAGTLEPLPATDVDDGGSGTRLVVLSLAFLAALGVALIGNSVRRRRTSTKARDTSG